MKNETSLIIVYIEKRNLKYTGYIVKKNKMKCLKEAAK